MASGRNGLRAGRQVRWPEEREYGEETKSLVHKHIAAYPFVPIQFNRWQSVIPQGIYRATKEPRHYELIYTPHIGPVETLLRIRRDYHEDDAWCRVVIAVARDANRRMR